MSDLREFKSFLSSVDPGNIYIITKIDGPDYNIAIRAERESKQDIEERAELGNNTILKDNNVVVLKYAPPMMEAIVPGMNWCKIQLTEAHALHLLHDRFDVLETNPFVKVPEVLNHDQKQNILCLSDLGPLVRLSEAIKKYPSSREPIVWRKVGRNLGSFLADLHSSETREKITSEDTKILNWPGQNALLYDSAMGPLLQNIQDMTFLEPDPETDAEELYDIIKADFSREISKKEESFVIGEFRTVGVLLYPDPPEGTADEKSTGIINFDFAHVGKGFAEDFGQIMANLALLEMNGEDLGKDWKDVTRQFIEGCAEGYKQMALERKAWWIKEIDGEIHFDAMALRSSYLALGREMINMALEYISEWKCSCCEDSISLRERGRKCRLILKMKKKGVWYLKMSGKDAKDFIGNWEMLKEGDRIFKGLRAEKVSVSEF